MLALVGCNFPNIPIASYTVGGTVVDDQGQPLAGVSVQLDSSKITTTQSGTFTFPGVSQGAHHLTATKSGYDQCVMDITVAADMTNLQLTLAKLQTYNLQILVKDAANGNALQGSVIVKNGAQVIDTKTGSDVTFSLYEGDYQVVVSATGYLSKTENVSLHGDSTKSIMLSTQPVVTTYTLSGTVRDSKDSTALSNVKIVIDNKTVYTDNTGKYSVDLEAGTYTLEATKTGYQKNTESVTISNSKDFSFEMIPVQTPTYSVTVKVFGTNNTALNDATTNLTNTANNTLLGTKTGALVTFSGVAAGSYRVDISASNYKAYSMTFTVNGDYTHTATLEPNNQTQTASASGTVSFAQAQLAKFISMKNTSIKKVKPGFAKADLRQYDGILVKFKNHVKEEEANKVLSTFKTSNMKKHLFGMYTMKTYDNPEDAMTKLKNNRDVEYVQYNYINRAFGTPNDEYYPYQWNLQMINLPAAWNIVKGGSSNVVVAVLDTGIRSHYDLNANIVKGYDTVENDTDPTDNVSNVGSSHGTHVASIIGAVTNNTNLMAGAGWNLKVMPVKVFCRPQGSEEPIAYSSDVIEGIYLAVDGGADIINLSLGFADTVPSENPAFEAALQYASQHGVAIFAASGNDGESKISYPASSEYCFSVGAVDYQGNRSYFSNYGNGLCITAPGGSAQSNNDSDLLHWILGYDSDTYPNSTDPVIAMIGTSQASPHAAAVAGLVRSIGVTDPEKIYDILINSAYSKNDTFHYGAGIVDAEAAVNLAKQTNSANITDAKIAPAIKTTDGWNILSSDLIVYPNQNGQYTVNGIQAGISNVYIIGYIDKNNNNELEAGDYFGASLAGHTYSAGEQQTNINFKLSEISGTQSVKSLSILKK